MPYLSTRRVERALRRLAELAAAEHLVLEVALCRGAVINVAYPESDSGAENAKIVQPDTRTIVLAGQVAGEQRLPADWMQEDVKFYLAQFAAHNRQDFDAFGPQLILSVSEPAHLLAMKMYACNALHPPAPGDVTDVGFLIQKMGLSSWSAVMEAYQRFSPGCSLSDDVRSVVVKMISNPV